MGESEDKLRLDKWLWHARFFKSRSLAAAAVEAGVRVDGLRITKSSRTVAPGDTVTFVQGRRVRVVRILELGTRRGPAPEAQALYEDLTPPDAPGERPGDAAPGPRTGGARPTKRARRALDTFKGEG